jgi:uncharacterized protein YcfL
MKKLVFTLIVVVLLISACSSGSSIVCWTPKS